MRKRMAGFRFPAVGWVRHHWREYYAVTRHKGTKTTGFFPAALPDEGNK